MAAHVPREALQPWSPLTMNVVAWSTTKPTGTHAAATAAVVANHSSTRCEKRTSRPSVTPTKSKGEGMPKKMATAHIRVPPASTALKLIPSTSTLDPASGLGCLISRMSRRPCGLPSGGHDAIHRRVQLHGVGLFHGQRSMSLCQGRRGERGELSKSPAAGRADCLSLARMLPRQRQQQRQHRPEKSPHHRPSQAARLKAARSGAPQ
eukprot:scaffold1712_cov261-Pinguiococcus_pyrenoidosus.AAC.5